MSETQNKGWITQVLRVEATMPPRDGTWIEARLLGDKKTIALQFDPKLKRWFNGKGHAVAQASIFQWFKV